MVEPSAWDSRSRFPTGMWGTGQAPRFRFWGGEEQSLEVAFKQLGGPYTLSRRCCPLRGRCQFADASCQWTKGNQGSGRLRDRESENEANRKQRLTP